ncbi:MAG TPA: iron-containing redox enzyme family protein [Kofleriaceae bacterium]
MVTRRSRVSLAQLGTEQLAGLAGVLGMTDDLPRMQSIFTELLGVAADRTAPMPAYPSDVVDDHTPYELSLVFGGATPELRMLVETSQGDHSLSGRWNAGRRASEWLREHHGADLSRFERIEDLFEPRTPQGLFALWHAIVFRAGGAPEAKVYLDLRARGTALAPALLEEALDRLELGGAYPALMREACPRGLARDELVYFSLDLAAHATARVKVYFRHHRANASDLERVIGDRGGVGPGEVAAFCETMLGSAGPYTARPVVSCWSFSAGTEPSGATIYAPIAYYVRDDAEARARIHRWLDGQNIDVERYDRCVATYARRPLDRGAGMHSYVSFKRDATRPKLTCYLAPEAYRTFAPGELADRTFAPAKRPSRAVDMVHWLETVERCSDHPLFRRLAREPAAVTPIWTILANNWVGIGDRFPRWLAALVARVEDDRVRSVLAKQLDDELGHGDPTRAHRLLFQRMLADLEPYAPPLAERDRLLGPGRRLAHGLADSYLARPELEAIGGTLVAEVYGKQVDQALGDLLRRQQELDVNQLTWLVLHETLEEDHADESAELAAMMPQDRDAQAAVCRGADNIVQLGMRYFDDIYEVMFG